MFKKMLVIVISVLMVFILGACGNNNPQARKNAETDSLTENGAKSVSEIANDVNSENIHEKADKSIDIRKCLFSETVEKRLDRGGMS